MSEKSTPARPSAIFCLEDCGDDFRGLTLAPDQNKQRGLALLEQCADPLRLQKEMAQKWKPNLKVSLNYKNKKYTDIPHLMGGVLVFSENAVQCLDDILKDAAEVLPLESPEQPLYLIRPRRMLVALRRESSEINWLSQERGIARSIGRYDFDLGMIAANHLFRIRELPRNFYVTDSFVKRVEKCKLKGFEFPKVWPL